MAIIRIIVVIVVALSIATLPTIAATVVFSNSAAASITDGGDTHGMPCNKPADDCRKHAGCALKCFNFSGVIFASPLLHLPAAEVSSLFAVDRLPSHTGIPPFRPPQS